MYIYIIYFNVVIIYERKTATKFNISNLSLSLLLMLFAQKYQTARLFWRNFCTEETPNWMNFVNEWELIKNFFLFYCIITVGWEAVQENAEKPNLVFELAIVKCEFSLIDFIHQTFGGFRQSFLTLIPTPLF